MIDIKAKLTAQEKQAIENLRVETQVLRNLVVEKHNQASELLTGIFQKLGYNPQLYGLEFNAAQDKWALKLRPDVIATPGQNLPLPKGIKGN